MFFVPYDVICRCYLNSIVDQMILGKHVNQLTASYEEYVMNKPMNSELQKEDEEESDDDEGEEPTKQNTKA